MAFKENSYDYERCVKQIKQFVVPASNLFEVNATTDVRVGYNRKEIFLYIGQPNPATDLVIFKRTDEDSEDWGVPINAGDMMVNGISATQDEIDILNELIISMPKIHARNQPEQLARLLLYGLRITQNSPSGPQ